METFWGRGGELLEILIDFNEVLSVLMLCAPSNCQWPFSYHMKMPDFALHFVRFLMKKLGRSSEKCVEYDK